MPFVPYFHLLRPEKANMMDLSCRLTVEKLSRLPNPPRTPIDHWRKKLETHEQMAVGEKTSRSAFKTEMEIKQHQRVVERKEK